MDHSSLFANNTYGIDNKAILPETIQLPLLQPQRIGLNLKLFEKVSRQCKIYEFPCDETDRVAKGLNLKYEEPLASEDTNLIPAAWDYTNYNSNQNFTFSDLNEEHQSLSYLDAFHKPNTIHNNFSDVNAPSGDGIILHSNESTTIFQHAVEIIDPRDEIHLVPITEPFSWDCEVIFTSLEPVWALLDVLAWLTSNPCVVSLWLPVKFFMCFYECLIIGGLVYLLLVMVSKPLLPQLKLVKNCYPDSFKIMSTLMKCGFYFIICYNLIIGNNYWLYFKSGIIYCISNFLRG